jgi:hypothetical protein
MKEQILKLRLEGKTYSEINIITGASKATISYHCKRNNLDGRLDGKGIGDKDINKINIYYKTHTLNETSEYFKVGLSTLKTVLEKKRKVLTDKEKLEYNYFHVKSFRKKNKERSVEYKGGKCVKCGYNKCVRALEFHHIDPSQKDFAPSQNMNMSWDRIKIELDKCILVCSNCHREIHEDLEWQVSTQSDTLE